MNSGFCRSCGRHRVVKHGQSEIYKRPAYDARAFAVLGRFCQVAQHIVQHAAIFDVINLNFRIDPTLQADLFHIAISVGDRARHFGQRLNIAGQARDRHRLIAFKSQRRPAVAARELKRDDAHADEV